MVPLQLLFGGAPAAVHYSGERVATGSQGPLTPAVPPQTGGVNFGTASNIQILGDVIGGNKTVSTEAANLVLGGEEPRFNQRERLEQLMEQQVHVRPAIPIIALGGIYTVRNANGDMLELHKDGSCQKTWIPMRRVTFIAAAPHEIPYLQLDGRLQWLTLAQSWRFFPESPLPHDELGLGRSSDDHDLVIAKLQSRGDQIRFADRGKIASHMSNGYEVVYDDQGFYLKRGDPANVQILMSKNGRLTA